MLLETYDDCKLCITVPCRMMLDLNSAEQCHAAIRDHADYGTQKFIATCSEPSRAHAIGRLKLAEGTVAFACQRQRIPDGLTSADDRPHPRVTGTLSLMPRWESEVSE